MFQSIRQFSQSSVRSAFAKMQLFGSVGNISAKETKNGAPFITYSLAVNRFAPGEENNSTTDWYNISVFNDKHVQFFNDYLKPGMQLFVECDVRQNAYLDENETKRYSTNLTQTSYNVVRFAKRQEEPEESA